jgi:hypothetical protein
MHAHKVVVFVAVGRAEPVHGRPALYGVHNLTRWARLAERPHQGEQGIGRLRWRRCGTWDRLVGCERRRVRALRLPHGEAEAVGREEAIDPFLQRGGAPLERGRALQLAGALSEGDVGFTEAAPL